MVDEYANLVVEIAPMSGCVLSAPVGISVGREASWRR